MATVTVTVDTATVTAAKKANDQGNIDGWRRCNRGETRETTVEVKDVNDGVG